VSEERARKVAEILFPHEVPSDHPKEWRGTEWAFRVAQVRAAIQSTFPLSADTPSQGNSETTQNT
jgi:hypothetical protein